MKLIFNDANILIDLILLELLPPFFDLQLECHTTSIILDELHEDQLGQLSPFIEDKLLLVHELKETELEQIMHLRNQRPSLSEQDCSALYKAQVLSGTLLTSDNSLRKAAISKRVEVHGHLWVFDRMVESETIMPKMASNKLKDLCSSINPKLGLPKSECDRRHKEWNSRKA